LRKLAIGASEPITAALRQEVARSPQSRFAHRLHCIALVAAGKSCYEVARAFGDDPRSVERWVRGFQQFGIDALRDKPHTGRHASLTEYQMRQLRLALATAPRDFGYAADAWSDNLLRREILRQFDITLSLRHCRRLFMVLDPSHRR
jgi:transposase